MTRKQVAKYGMVVVGQHAMRRCANCGFRELRREALINLMFEFQLVPVNTWLGVGKLRTRANVGVVAQHIMVNMCKWRVMARSILYIARLLIQ